MRMKSHVLKKSGSTRESSKQQVAKELKEWLYAYR